MSISSVSAPTPVNPVDMSASNGTNKSSDTTAGADGGTPTASHQPTPAPPLPPGQGTRVDQLA